MFYFCNIFNLEMKKENQDQKSVIVPLNNEAKLKVELD
jgi:hypothetical protein